MKPLEPRAVSRGERVDTATTLAIASGPLMDPWLEYLADVLARKFLREITERSA